VGAMLVQCQSCGRELSLVFPHRLLIVFLAGLLAWGVPALAAKNPGITILMFVIFFFPGLPLAAQIVTTIIPPRYELQKSAFTTLFSH